MIAPRPRLPPALAQQLSRQLGRDLGALRSLRLRAVLVAVGVALVPILLVWAASGFEVGSGEIFRLVLAVVPVALVVGWWLGWRMVRPVERLTDVALAQALDAAPDTTFDLGRTDEFGALGMALDTLVARLGQQLRANEDFVADLAHELKNPLAAIRTVGERLQADADRGGEVDPARVARMARILARSTSRLDALVSELLELARAEGGMQGEAWGPVALGALAGGVTERIASDPRYEAVEFAVDVDPEVRVEGVSGRLETAIANLVDNAASFNVDGPGKVEVSVRVAGAWARLEVCDTGPGIPPEALPRVFERFFTTRATATGGGPRGTGLGLALVAAVARAHGGEASVTSEPGVRTCFAMRIPALPSA